MSFSRRNFKEEFIRRSKEVWGEDAFDYSKVEYKNMKDKVILICKEHNIEFSQRPQSNLKKYIGCPECIYDKTGQHKSGYWTYERCYEVAKKYKWVKDFKKDEMSCYTLSRQYGYLKDFTWLKRHYDENENILTAKKHLIYGYIFTEINSVYIGLTLNLEQRDKQHHKIGSLYNFCKEHNFLIPEPQIIEGNLTLEEVKERESYWIGFYKENGYDLINKTKGGDSVGLLCKISGVYTVGNFIEKANLIHKKRYLYDKVEYVNSQTKVCIICPIHGEFLQKPNNHIQGQKCPKCGDKDRRTKRIVYTYEYSKEQSIGCKNRTSFQKKNKGAYYASLRNGWLDEFFPKK